MQRKEIDPFTYATHILQALGQGVLLTTMAQGRVNTMTIGWGFMGIDWKLPVFVTLVRSGRFSRTLLDKNPEFSVNIPVGNFERRILGFAGTTSGRDVDKIGALSLHTVPGYQINVPAILELPLTLECKVIYQKQQDPSAIPVELREAWHPQHVDSSAPGANRDYHIAYYGAIVSASILQ